MFNPFRSHRADTFAKELAVHVMAGLGSVQDRSDKAFRKKADRVLSQAKLRVDTFKREHGRPNWLQRSACANSFLWALKDAGCPEAYARELTEWFVLNL